MPSDAKFRPKNLLGICTVSIIGEILTLVFEPKGVIPAMITPFHENQELNEEGIRCMIRFLTEAKVHGIFVAGSQGEFWALSRDEKKRLFEISVDEANGKVPIYAGTGAESTREAIELSQAAEDIGADAVSIITPYYIKPTSRELFQHYSTVADKIDLPIVLYNNPERTGVNLTQEVVLELAETFSNIVAIKESSGDMTTTSEFIRRCGHRIAVLVGRDTLIYSSLAYGAKGAIAATANVVPKLVVEIYEAFLRGDHTAALRAQFRLAPLRLAFALGTFPVAIKEAANLVGLPAGPPREPVSPINPENRDKLKNILRDCGLSVLQSMHAL